MSSFNFNEAIFRIDLIESVSLLRERIFGDGTAIKWEGEGIRSNHLLSHGFLKLAANCSCVTQKSILFGF